MSEAAEKVIKKSIAKVLNDRGELDLRAISGYVRDDTGHGASRIKTCLSEMVGAREVVKKPRKLPKKIKTTYVLTDKGREWI